MVSGEGGEMNALGGGVSWGGAPAPAYSICWPEKLPPSVVGFCPERHSSHWGGIPPSGGSLGAILPTILFQGSQHGSPAKRDHPPISQAGRAVDYKSDSFRLG